MSGKEKIEEVRAPADCKSLPGNRKMIGSLLHKCSRTMFFNSKVAVQQTEILLLLKDGPMSQKDIQERLGVQPATVSELISKLETKGMVQRGRSDMDRRVVVLTITDLGLRAAERRLNEKAEREIEICLDDDEQKMLIELLQKLSDGFDRSLKDQLE